LLTSGPPRITYALLQDELGSLIGESSNRTLFVLTVVTVLALSFNVVGGLFGMNVGGIPFADSPAGFWLIVLLVGAFTSAVALWAFGQRPQ
jgi:zinc transporter